MQGLTTLGSWSRQRPKDRASTTPTTCYNRVYFLTYNTAEIDYIQLILDNPRIQDLTFYTTVENQIKFLFVHVFVY